MLDKFKAVKIINLIPVNGLTTQIEVNIYILQMEIETHKKGMTEKQRDRGTVR